jgi:hypothetical protein
VTDAEADLELDSPAFTCGDCRFTTRLSGHWSIEYGRLVFRADPDPQPGRGPTIAGCSESDHITSFARVVTETGQIINGDALESLMA